MEKIIEYYRDNLVFHPELYICCCEYYDLELLSEESYEMFVYDQILNTFNNREKNSVIWKNISDKEIEEYLNSKMI